MAIRRKLTSEVRGQVLEIRQSTEAEAPLLCCVFSLSPSFFVVVLCVSQHFLSFSSEVSAETRKKNVLLSTQYRYGNTTIEEKKAAGEELILKAQARRCVFSRNRFSRTVLSSNLN